MNQPILDRSFDTCQAALDELDLREAEAQVSGGSLANLVAVFDPTTAHVVLLTRDDYLQTYTRPAERAFVAHVDPPDTLRVVMLDGNGSGRSLLLADLESAMVKASRDLARAGRRYV